MKKRLAKKIVKNSSIIGVVGDNLKDFLGYATFSTYGHRQVVRAHRRMGELVGNLKWYID